MQTRLKYLVRRWYFPAGIVAILLLLLALLARNPFNDRTLIANFEPFPDAFYYVVPTQQFLQGRGFVMRFMDNAPYHATVPPVYSLVLVPVYALLGDPRSFAVTNSMLMAIFVLGGLHFLFRQTRDRLLVLLAGGVLLSSVYVSWLPTIAMAENVLLLWYLLAAWILVRPVRYHWALAAGALPWVLYATKFSLAPATVVLCAVFGVRLALDAWRTRRWRNVVGFLLASAGVFGLLQVWQFTVQGTTIFAAAFTALWSSLVKSSVADAIVAEQTEKVFWAFSLRYVPEHFPRYAAALLGRSEFFLWRTEPLLPAPWLWLGWAGLLWLLVKVRQARWFATTAVALLVAQTTFLSAFYVVDMRYAIGALVLLWIAGMWALSDLLRRFPSRARLGIVLALGMALAALAARQWKYQIALNLRHAETPWYAIAVREVNAALPGPASRQRWVITAMNPYLFHFFGNQQYRLLPLSDQQDFIGEAEKVWGDVVDKRDLHGTYRRLLLQGDELYYASYGLGHVAPFLRAAQDLRSSFSVELLRSGCFDVCNIYTVQLPASASAQPAL